MEAAGYIYATISDYCSGLVIGEASAMKLPKKVSIPCTSGESAEGVYGSLGSFKSVTVNLS